MVRNNLGACCVGNVAKLFMKECVWHPLCCQRAAHQRSSSLSHLCHLIFIPIKTLFHISFLSLRCLFLLLFPVCVSPCFFHIISLFFYPISTLFNPFSWFYSFFSTTRLSAFLSICSMHVYFTEIEKCTPPCIVRTSFWAYPWDLKYWHSGDSCMHADVCWLK